jgi:molybdopterin molybdotransferase
MSGYDPEALHLTHARELIARLMPVVEEWQAVPIREALGRVLSEDVVSGINVPARDNSAMDGYALRSGDLEWGAPTTLDVVGTVSAGQVATRRVLAGQCVRIMTGAVMPPELDTVVPQELVKVRDARVTIAPGAVRPGDNRRLAGEDLSAGKSALAAGRVLTPSDIGLLASMGIGEVPVRRRARVAIFSTGNELHSIGEQLTEGSVYDSNRHTLWAMLSRLGVETADLGVVKDDPSSLEVALRDAASWADVVITSGGVGPGDSDHTKRTMARLGDVVFWRIAMRPGRPMAFGRIVRDSRTTVLFGLPGNPVAVMVTFYALVRDALLALSGATVQPLFMLKATSVNPIRKKPGRIEYQRGIVTRSTDNTLQVAVTGAQGSGVLRSMSEANGLVILPHEQGDVSAGMQVEVLPFHGLI